MGGSKIPPNFSNGLTTCSICNPEYEHALQSDALRLGWKVRRWVKDPGWVPVYYRTEGAWYQIDNVGSKFWVTKARATEMMREVYGHGYSTITGDLEGEES
jgi:hypothetical protein